MPRVSLPPTAGKKQVMRRVTVPWIATPLAVEVIANPSLDRDAQEAVADEPPAVAVLRYFQAQRALRFAQPRSIVGLPAETALALYLASPEGQAAALAGIDHPPGSLVARCPQAVVVRRLLSWRDTSGRADCRRQLALLRDCALATPPLSDQPPVLMPVPVAPPLPGGEPAAVAPEAEVTVVVSDG
jgi:hypothetical protein